MADASQYTSRRASAAAAAEAHSIVPINSKSTRKRKEATEGDADTNRSRGVRTPRRAPPASRLLDDRGRLALLQTHGDIDADEAYGEQEKALSEFLRLHPMLSLCARFVEPHPTTIVSSS